MTVAVVAIYSGKQSSTRELPYEIIHGQTIELRHERLFPWPNVGKKQEDQKKSSEKVNKIRVTVRDRLLAKQEKMRMRINAHWRKPREYTPGYLVLVARNLRKIEFRTNILPKYTGLFQVLRKHSPLSYLVKDVVAKVPSTR